MEMKNKRKTPCLPQIIIGGAAKSGTTSLYNALSASRRFYFPEHKEPYFFSFPDGYNFKDMDPDFSSLIFKNIDSYLSLFDKSNVGQIIGEASTSYLYTADTTIKKILQVYSYYNQPLPKMYFILRNPTKRAWSHHQFLSQRGVESLNFRDAIEVNQVSQRLNQRCWDFDYLDYGKYAEGVELYLKSPISVKFYLMEDIMGEGLDNVVKNIMNDFSISHHPNLVIERSSNPSGRPKNKLLVSLLARDNFLKYILRNIMPYRSRVGLRKVRDRVLASLLVKQEMDEDLINRLSNYYHDDNVRLSKLLNRNLDHWS